MCSIELGPSAANFKQYTLQKIDSIKVFKYNDRTLNNFRLTRTP